MSDQDVLAALGEIVQEATGIPAARVVPGVSFRDDLDIDSLSMVEIATMAEDKFGVSIPDAELAKLKTVGDVVDFLSAAGVPA
ncbi:MAG TPA: acyl carrier protein [Mycobacteriales bacterium]|jgi:acyl carrier protein|nr:acyl carrier protein [Mycobacteriales bacterium]